MIGQLPVSAPNSRRRQLRLSPPPAQAAGPDDVPEGAQRFPRDLYEAARKMAESDTAARIFGTAFVENFTAACLAEDASLRTAVSAEERRRYLEA